MLSGILWSYAIQIKFCAKAFFDLTLLVPMSSSSNGTSSPYKNKVEGALVITIK